MPAHTETAGNRVGDIFRSSSAGHRFDSRDCTASDPIFSGASQGLETVPEGSEREDSVGVRSPRESDETDPLGGAAAARVPNGTAVGLDDSSWIRRPRRGAIPDERATSAARVTALETSLRGFAERKTEAVVSPAVGMTFDSIGEAYDFYNLYSWEMGFGIRYAKSRTNVKGAKCMQEFVCCCSGHPKKDNSASVRCLCPARIRLLRTDDSGWYICEYRKFHNHKLLSTCAQKLHFPSHRHIDKFTRELVAQLRENNVNLSKVYSIIGSFFGRIENVPFTKRCLRTLCGKISREQADDDVKKTMDIFSEMKANDSEFSYTVEVDDESRIKTLMWTNGRSKLQYHHFGDVVTFDTTYKTNLYDMPFGLFVGVNNHFQSVIYAGVLMREEKIESFEWVFKEFVKMMGGRVPVTILTDQARAMEVAIENVFPDTTHRWCKWHVLRKAKESLGTHYSKKGQFRDEFHNLVHDMLTKDEFERGWVEIIHKYGLQGNTFLQQVFEVRHKWAKPYFSGKFCAKQTSTQRSESANHMLKIYVPPACPMNLFVRQYAKLQFDREQEEGFQEKRTLLGGAVLKSNLPIERHASKVYTRKMFEQFGQVLFRAGSFVIEEIIAFKKYVATHVNSATRSPWRRSRYEIEISDDGEFYSCECGMYEHMGMVCSHSLKVMIVLGLQKLPSRHIMKRWTVDARDILPDHLKHYQKDMGPPEAPTFRHNAMYITALEIVQLGDTNPEAFEHVMTGLISLKSSAGKLCLDPDGRSLLDKANAAQSSAVGKKDGGSKNVSEGRKRSPADGIGAPNSGKRGKQAYSAGSCGTGVDDSADSADILSPLSNIVAPAKKKGRGHPSTARDKPGYELTGKRTRFCTVCRQAGHKSTTCPMRGDVQKKERKVAECSNCGLPGHRKNTCCKPLVSFLPSISSPL